MSAGERIELEKAEIGRGNTVRLTADFVQRYGSDLRELRPAIYRVAGMKSNGRVDAVLTTPEAVCALTGEELSGAYYLISKEALAAILERPADPLEQRTEMYEAMRPAERTKVLRAIRSKLQNIQNSDAHPMAKAKAIMDTVEHSFSINKASMKVQLQSSSVHVREIASETAQVVNSALSMIESSETAVMLFEAFKGLSNGQTLNHVTRVFSLTAAYFHFYNLQVQERLAQKVRLAFRARYYDAYRVILPSLDEHLFTSDNLIPLPLIEPPVMKEWALGAFLHDIGKIANLDYFESASAYDAEQIRQHVFLGAGLILMNYGTEHEEARLMAADHHNALFRTGGYGVIRLEREKGLRKLAPVERCISFSAHEYLSGKALGFLPTEMLAIVDIYDAMTDVSRAYKKAMSPTEALAYMRTHPVAEGRLDPVLFDVFAAFIKTNFPTG